MEIKKNKATIKKKYNQIAKSQIEHDSIESYLKQI